jgi:hypothetical protein
MKKLTKLLTILLSIVGINYASAQCAAGEVAVTVDVTTDAWGYEVYWELVPAGNPCGVGTVASGGNATVGCTGGGAQSIGSGGYANNTTTTDGPFCLVIGQDYDLIMIDDWGDGLCTFYVVGQATPYTPTGATDTITFTASDPANNDVAIGLDYTDANGWNTTYGRITGFVDHPLDQLDTSQIFAGINVKNLGLNIARNVNVALNIDIFQAGAFTNVYTDTMFFGDIDSDSTLVQGGTIIDTAWWQEGNFRYQYIASHDSVDERTETDTITNYFNITNNVWCKGGLSATPGVAFGDNIYFPGTASYIDGYEWGSMYQFYDGANKTIDSLNIGMYSSNAATAATADVQLRVYEVNQQAAALDLSTDLTLVGLASQTVAVVPGLLNNVVFDNVIDAITGTTEFEFSDDTRYYITSYQENTTAPYLSDGTTTNGLYVLGVIQNHDFHVYSNGSNFTFYNPLTITTAGTADSYTTGWVGGPEPSMVMYLGSTLPTCTVGATLSGNNVTTNGGSNGDVTAAVTGDQGIVSYLWSNAAATAAINSLVAGVYSVTVTDDIVAGCQAVESFTITEPAALSCAVSVTLSGNNVTTNGGSNGDASASVAGGQSTISYAWSTGGTSSAITNLVAGVYSVTVSDNILAGCTATATITITEPIVIVTCDVLVNLSVTAATTAGGSDGAAEALVSGAQGNLTYAWSNGGTTSMITGLPTNTYSVTVTDDVLAGCAASASGLVTDPSVTVSCNLTVTATSTDPTAFGTSDGSATAVAAGNQGNLSYLWDNTATTQVINGLTGGVFTVTVTDNITAGCAGTASVTLTEPGLTCNIGASMSQNNVTTNGGSDGDAAVVAIGGQGNITYMWAGGETTTSISGLAAGVYAVTVMDDIVAACQAVGTVTITEPGGVSCTLGGSTTSTNVSTNAGADGSSIVVATGVQGNVTYVWSNAATTAAISGLAAGTYVVTITDDIVADCEVIVSTTITEPAVNGIGEIAEGTTVSVYPNPNNGTFTVNTSKDGDYLITVRNVIGQTINSTNLKGSIVEIRVNDVNAGFYFVTIQGEGFEKTEKIIVR